MSLLGKLFSNLPTAANNSTSRPQTALDSNLEDHFTYNLLFPDAEALCHHDQVFSLSQSTVLTNSATNAFDYNPEFDLDQRDVRVIIMQEATPASGSAYLLYDSMAPPPSASLSTSPTVDRQPATNASAFASRESRRSISSPRKPSIGQNSRPVVIQQQQQQDGAASRGLAGAFDRRSTHMKGLSYTETEVQRSQREYREEITTFSNCIFGNSDVLAYKGTGTKVHILPSESRSVATPGSFAGDAAGSLGRSSLRSSKLAQSYTSENIGFSIPTGSSSTSYSSRGSERRKILITRMFPVPLHNDSNEPGDRTPTPQKNKLDDDATGFPFPNVIETNTTGTGTTNEPGVEEKKPKKKQPKQKRTPMYAVGLVVHLPPPSHPTLTPGSRSSFRGPGSYNEQESCASSYGSARRAGWTMLGSGYGVESLDSSLSSDVDDRLDTVTQHWDIIMRTLSHLQAIATASLLPMLKLADINSPEPRREGHMRTPSASISISGKRVEEAKPHKLPKTTVKMVQLTPHCLMQVPAIQKEVDSARQRIVYGIKAKQVVTGQGRWGIWREEARWVGKWACGKEEGFFFYNLLTAFLGSHTAWLQALGPTWYRRRHYQQHRAHKDDDVSLPARTIIVSDDKMAARRLIFLLSAFLPANNQLSPALRFHRPSTSTSFGGFSQSPPTGGGGVPILREESLRRKMNKRLSKNKISHTRTMSFPTQIQQSHPAMEFHHAHRPSDASSMKTANLPIPGSEGVTRKSSAATTSTITPVTTVSHFSTRRQFRGSGSSHRPGSSGSVATDDLLRSLKRGESTGHQSNASSDSQSNSRWGSMISGFWSGRRRDSTATTDYSPSIDGVEIYDPHYKGDISPPKGKLAKMVKEVAASKGEVPRLSEPETERKKSEADSIATAKADSERHSEEAPTTPNLPQRIPDPSGAFESPVKTSITDDGVIDIDVPLPEYLSFDTAISSPSSSGYLSTVGFSNGLEGFEHYARCSTDTETTLNVAGWLQRYHPDFALQAVPVQEDLIEEIKASMRAEPTPVFLPHPDHSPSDRWIDISSAIVADTTTFTIKRIRYQRYIKPKTLSEQAIHSLATSFETTTSRYGNPYTTAQLTPGLETHDSSTKDRFIEDAVISMDETLIEAVERIMAQSGQSSVSKTSSACSSRSASRPGDAPRDRSDSDAAFRNGANGHSHATLRATPIVAGHRLEVPRNECKKMVLGALEEIVREVAESRKDHSGSSSRIGDLMSDDRRESFLREGIRSWLANVEAME